MTVGGETEVKGVADFFADMITDGDLTTFVRPFGRTGAHLLDRDAWDSGAVMEMIATGVCARPANRGGPSTHYVFLRSVEVDAILLCYGPRGDQIDPEGSRMVESERRLGAILASLRGIPSPGEALRQEDPTPLLNQFPNAIINLNTTDMGRLVKMACLWLEKAFGDEDNAGLSRDDFKRMAIEEFRPLMTGPRFDFVWRDTVALEAFEHWGRPGPRTKKVKGPKPE